MELEAVQAEPRKFTAEPREVILLEDAEDGEGGEDTTPRGPAEEDLLPALSPPPPASAGAAIMRFSCRACDALNYVAADRVGQPFVCPECRCEQTIPYRKPVDGTEAADWSQRPGTRIQAQRASLPTASDRVPRAAGGGKAAGGKTADPHAPIRFHCPTCRALLYAEASRVGEPIDCPDCHLRQRIPPRAFGAVGVADDFEDQGSGAVALEVPEPVEPAAVAGGSTASPPIGADETIRFSCTLCQSMMYAQGRQVGDAVRCPDCHQAQRVPAVRKGGSGKALSADEIDVDTVPFAKGATAASRGGALPTPPEATSKLIRYRCRLCHTLMYAEPSEAGTVIACPDCHQRQRVPATSGGGGLAVEDSPSAGQEASSPLDDTGASQGTEQRADGSAARASAEREPGAGLQASAVAGSNASTGASEELRGSFPGSVTPAAGTGQEVSGGSPGAGTPAEELTLEPLSPAERFYCELCGSLMYSGSRGAGDAITCPDCHRRQVVPAAGKGGLSASRRTGVERGVGEDSDDDDDEFGLSEVVERPSVGPFTTDHATLAAYRALARDSRPEPGGMGGSRGEAAPLPAGPQAPHSAAPGVPAGPRATSGGPMRGDSGEAVTAPTGQPPLQPGALQPGAREPGAREPGAGRTAPRQSGGGPAASPRAGWGAETSRGGPPEPLRQGPPVRPRMIGERPAPRPSPPPSSPAPGTPAPRTPASTHHVPPRGSAQQVPAQHGSAQHGSAQHGGAGPRGARRKRGLRSYLAARGAVFRNQKVMLFQVLLATVMFLDFCFISHALAVYDTGLIGAGTALLMFGLTFLSGIPTVMFCCNYAFIILQDSANSHNDFEWPNAWYMDFLWYALYLIVAGTCAAVPGVVVGNLLYQMGAPGWLIFLPVAASVLICFPIALLSALDQDSPVMPWSVAVFRSLYRAFAAWALLTLESLALACLATLSFELVRLNHVLAYFALACLLSFLFVAYFRVIGLVARRAAAA